MSAEVVFELKLQDFEGPLDLLDTLIREKKMDIMDLDVAAIAEQYYDFVQSQIRNISIDDASEYLAMSVYLLQLKSKKVIPIEINGNDENSFEYQRDKLIQRIIEYRKYKEIVQLMNKKREIRETKFSKRTNDLEDFEPNQMVIEALPKQIDPKKLYNALNMAFERYKLALYTQRKLVVQELSVSEVEQELWDFLTKNKVKKISFSEYLSKIDEYKISQQYIVTTFLAILNLAKFQKIELSQIQKNDEIYIERILGGN